MSCHPKCSATCYMYSPDCSTAGTRSWSDGHEQRADHTGPPCAQGGDLYSAIFAWPGPAQQKESQRLQYGLAERAVSLGWPRSQVVVIDEDLGVSGRGGGITRIGFERLV